VALLLEDASALFAGIGLGHLGHRWYGVLYTLYLLPLYAGIRPVNFIAGIRPSGM